MIEEILIRLTDWGKSKKRTDTEVTPYFSDSHKFGSELKERLSYHAEFDVFPEKLINSAAPNEDPKEYKFRKQNYKQTTKSTWDKALSTTYRIFNPQNYSIEWNDDEVKDYFTYTYPRCGSLVEYFKDVVHKMKFADPNAVIAVKPAFIPMKEEIEGEQVIYSVDQSEKITPINELFPADRVFEFRDDWCLVMTKEKSLIKVNARDKKEGLIFELYDRENIYKIIQTGDQKDWTFEAFVYYEHKWEQTPAWKLKGIPYYDPVDILYYSHFMCAVSNLDEAAVLNSTSFGVINKVAYPTRWYYEDDCSVCNGEGRKMDYELDKLVTCNSCHGSGHKMTFSFGKDFVIPMPENVAQTDTTTLPTPPFGVVDPPVASITFLDEKVKFLKETAFLNLNISVTDKPTGVTATEKDIDEDELISFLMQISGEEFYLMEEIIDAHTFMRWGKEDVVEVKKPTEFRIRSSADLTEELKKGIEAKLPAPYLLKLLDENIEQRFQNDKDMPQLIKTVALIDPLMTADNLTVNSMASDGSIEKWQKNLHYCIYNFLYLKLEENPKYLETDINTIKTDMETMSKSMVVKTPNTAVDILGSL